MAVALSPGTGPDVLLQGRFLPFIMLCVMLCFPTVKQGQISTVSRAGPQRGHFEKNPAALIL